GGLTLHRRDGQRAQEVDPGAALLAEANVWWIRGAAVVTEAVSDGGVDQADVSNTREETADYPPPPCFPPSITDCHKRRPSSPPISASQARSGCGIIPSTFPRSLMMPAILRSLPLGLASAVTAPARVE